jgi:hypothetical protein
MSIFVAVIQKYADKRFEPHANFGVIFLLASIPSTSSTNIVGEVTWASPRGAFVFNLLRVDLLRVLISGQ